MTVDSETAASVRHMLRAARYDISALRELLGSWAGDVLVESRELPLHLRRLPQSGALPTLVRLFLLEADLEADAVASDLGDGSLEALERLGMVVRDGTAIRATMRLIPHREFVTAYDLPDESGRPDYVPGMQNPTALLANMTVRRPVRRALEVGTGFGFQALMLSTHADHVVATDINERALMFAELNLALNDVHNVELRLGSYLEPVAGEEFDLVVSNPPYVISPESRFVYRDSGLPADMVSRQLVEGLPAILAEGGFSTVLIGWAVTDDADRPVPQDWVTGCDAWLLHSPLREPLDVASDWNIGTTDDAAQFGKALDEWSDYYAREGIQGIAYGALVLRRRSGGATWFRSLRLTGNVTTSATDHIERLFSGQDHLASLEGGGVPLDNIYVLHHSVLLDQVSRLATGQVVSQELFVDEGIPLDIKVDGATAALLRALSPPRPLGKVLGGYADQLGASTDEIARGAWPMLRQLISVGLLVPVAAE